MRMRMRVQFRTRLLELLAAGLAVSSWRLLAASSLVLGRPASTNTTTSGTNHTNYLFTANDHSRTTTNTDANT